MFVVGMGINVIVGNFIVFLVVLLINLLGNVFGFVLMIIIGKWLGKG